MAGRACRPAPHSVLHQYAIVKGRVMHSNPSKARPGWPPVVVAGAYYTGIALMRNLVRRGLEVSCIECDSKMPGFKTLYGNAYLCPNPDERPAEWVEFMLRLGKKIGGRPVLIPSSDRFITDIGDH